MAHDREQQRAQADAGRDREPTLTAIGIAVWYVRLADAFPDDGHRQGAEAQAGVEELGLTEQLAA